MIDQGTLIDSGLLTVARSQDRSSDGLLTVQRCDSPWYGSVRLYRQRHRGVWSDVVQAVAGDMVGLG